MNNRLVRSVVAAAITVGAVTAGASSANAAPTSEPSVVLQVPGGVVGPYGAALYNPRVFYGHGTINPTPVGYGYVYQWRNLSIGASGTITDRTPGRQSVRTGAGQIVVSGQYTQGGQGLLATTPSVGTFYVGP